MAVTTYRAVIHFYVVKDILMCLFATQVCKAFNLYALKLQTCRNHGIISALYHPWKSKYSGVTVNEFKRVRELEVDNSRLKKIHSELAEENADLRYDLGRKLYRLSQNRYQ